MKEEYKAQAIRKKEAEKKPRGRPKGTTGITHIHSKAAVKKLEALGFDPIEKMIEMYNDIEEEIYTIKKSARPSQVAITNLISARQKIINDLMRYGYARTPETNELEVKETKPLEIKLDLGNNNPSQGE